MYTEVCLSLRHEPVALYNPNPTHTITGGAQAQPGQSATELTHPFNPLIIILMHGVATQKHLVLSTNPPARIYPSAIKNKIKRDLVSS